MSDREDWTADASDKSMHCSAFTWYPDGTVTVDDWCREQWISKEFLISAMTGEIVKAYVHEGNALIEFTVANGRAVYKVRWDLSRKQFWGQLIQAELDLVRT